MIPVIISAICSAVIAGGGGLLIASQSGEGITHGTLLIAYVSGLIAAAKDVQSRLALPPYPQQQTEPSRR